VPTRKKRNRASVRLERKSFCCFGACQYAHALLRKLSSDFSGLEGVEGTRFYREIERLGEFLVDYVISGELDRIYAETAN